MHTIHIVEVFDSYAPDPDDLDQLDEGVQEDDQEVPTRVIGVRAEINPAVDLKEGAVACSIPTARLLGNTGANTVIYSEFPIPGELDPARVVGLATGAQNLLGLMGIRSEVTYGKPYNLNPVGSTAD